MTDIQARVPGRPRKHPNEQRAVQNKQRYTQAEMDYIALMAERAGLTVSDFIRRAALKVSIQPPRPSEERDALRELSRIGVNLNQIARALNRGRETPLYIEDAILKLTHTLDKVAERYDP